MTVVLNIVSLGQTRPTRAPTRPCRARGFVPRPAVFHVPPRRSCSPPHLRVCTSAKPRCSACAWSACVPPRVAAVWPPRRVVGSATTVPRRWGPGPATRRGGACGGVACPSSGSKQKKGDRARHAPRRRAGGGARGEGGTPNDQRCAGAACRRHTRPTEATARRVFTGRAPVIFRPFSAQRHQPRCVRIQHVAPTTWATTAAVRLAPSASRTDAGGTAPARHPARRVTARASHPAPRRARTPHRRRRVDPPWGRWRTHGHPASCSPSPP